MSPEAIIVVNYTWVVKCADISKIKTGLEEIEILKCY